MREQCERSSDMSGGAEYVQQVWGSEKTGGQMVVARFHVARQSPGGRRDQGVGKQIERDCQCVGRLRVLANSPCRRDEFAIEGVTHRLEPGMI